jgi:hypothetical protein
MRLEICGRSGLHGWYIPMGLLCRFTPHMRVHATKLWYDLVLNGFSGWYLPSLPKLAKIYENKTIIGGFTDNFYWTPSKQFADGIYCSLTAYVEILDL